MKTSIKSLALLVALAYPVLAFAEFLGVRLPATVTAESLIGVFAAALMTLLLVGDYSRRTTRLMARAPVKACASSREANCLAA